MNGKVISLLIVIVLLVVMVFTRPSRADHKQAIGQAVNGYVADQVDDHADDVPLVGEIVKWGGREAVNYYLDNNFELDDYMVLNVGKLRYNGRMKTVSVGLLGHVFTVDKHDVKDAVDRKLRSLQGESADAEPETDDADDASDASTDDL